MNRSSYVDDPCVVWHWIMYRGAVASAVRGKRGQAFLCRLKEALEGMERKELIADELITPDGSVCALGRLGVVEGMDMKSMDKDDYSLLASLFNVSPALVRELEYINDTCVDIHWLYNDESVINNNSNRIRRYDNVLNWVKQQYLKRINK